MDCDNVIKVPEDIKIKPHLTWTESFNISSVLYALSDKSIKMAKPKYINKPRFRELTLPGTWSEKNRISWVTYEKNEVK